MNPLGIMSPMAYHVPFRPPRFVRVYRSIGQVSSQADTDRAMWIERGAHFGVFVAGLLVSILAFPHRAKPIGAIALGAGSSTVGVALTFLVMDLIGSTPRNA